jgi:hypothetical protein
MLVGLTELSAIEYVGLIRLFPVHGVKISLEYLIFYVTYFMSLFSYIFG